ncbi:methyltransferase domain-containing protein [Luteimonas composti]|uniref:Methyltransferase domain-containing protein n=1 Tax=Luteimonas composti TaxID=398257 RepID=A0ABT6MPW1_9GAMM|nr:class I SAM-dependent methyltransferase [Luteimonas composti]MDH7452390.1 methyltransferase domain-containing protein [Luteimonas composti]
MDAKKIFRLLVADAPYQPATNYWRAVELDVVARHGLPPGRTLDLGCGDGKLTRVLAWAVGNTQGRSWIGVDPDPAETALASNIELYDDVHTCGGDQIPEESGSFDVVLSNSVLEHIPDIEPVIAEVARVLRRGGRFVFTVPSSNFHSCLGGPLFGQITAAYRRRLDERCAHVRYWGLGDWAACLDKHGFDISAHVQYLNQKQTRRWERLSNMTGGLLYNLHGHRKRPIEIQRRLNMRRPSPSWLDRFAGRISHTALLGAELETRPEVGQHACLLLDAVRR